MHSTDVDGAALGLIQEPGIKGYFTRNQAPGAYPNGARVCKVSFEDGDAHPIGAFATVLGSLGPVPKLNNEFGYFVLWDDLPGVAVFTRGNKITHVGGKA